MTRHTEPLRDITATVRIEVDGERDERDSYRHKWFTRVRCGLLKGAGPNTAAATEALADELRELASCPEAIEALAMARHRAAAARAPETPKVAAPYTEGETVEIQLTTDQTLVPAEFLNSSHGGSLIAVWSERCGSLVIPKERVRAVNRPSLSDVG